MRVLLDESLPRRLQFELPAHEVTTVPERGWAGMKNGELLRLAESEFEVFVTMDSNLPSQQNLAELQIGVIVLKAKSNVLADLIPLAESLRSSVSRCRAGQVIVLTA